MNFLQQAIRTEHVWPLFHKMRLGLEKESQRINQQGLLAESPHPAALGSRSYHPYIQTDFSENQIELITPVVETPAEAIRFLSALHDVTLRSMPRDEQLWPMSMPPRLPTDAKQIRIAELEQYDEILYRRHLAKTYGKRKQMLSGIHYNFEFSPAFITELFANQSEFKTVEELRTYLYLKVARHYLRYRWFLTYLYGASPTAEANFFTAAADQPSEPVRSIRNSHYGYTNLPTVKASYASIEAYVTDIDSLIEKGLLSEEKEYYAAVRLRGGKKVADLRDCGVHYIEVRNIDLNPFAANGITEETIRFIQLFLMYMLWLEPETASADELVEHGNRLNDQVALEHPLAPTSCLAEGKEILAGMETMLKACGGTELDWQLMSAAALALAQPEKTIAGQMLQQTVQAGQTNAQLGRALAQTYWEAAWEKPYQLRGYADMELSTQIFMFDALQKGLELEILDEADQFLKLCHQGHSEYVKNANMTAKDQYIVPLIMENKTVTKKVLAKAGFRVPRGAEYGSLEQALAAYPDWQQKAIVVKPKSTNYGLGISIFKETAAYADYQTALEIAFAEDQQILVEEFMPGTEYRFFVIDGKTRAVLLRLPANVVGDGQHTVAELVAEKNASSLRGTHHRAPLEKIELGELEKLMLKEQGYTIESVPPLNQVVHLRENSNISTGGDSIDVTDEFDYSYKKTAAEAVAALGAKICGIDLIIPDKSRRCQKNGSCYGIIEANFNPAMHMHVYPYAGKGQRITMDVLRLLFPELNI